MTKGRQEMRQENRIHAEKLPNPDFSSEALFMITVLVVFVALLFTLLQAIH